MKTITINVKEDIEKKFRKIAAATFGKRKGYLGKAITEAMEKWTGESEKTKTIAESLELLEKGIKMKKWEFDRDETHGR